MKVFAISDLHLSASEDKPMSIFGGGWENHFEKISADWSEKVSDDDIVLLGGDLSWGMTMDEAAPDYAAISALKGRKIVVKGNHDYYWGTLSKMQSRFDSFDFLQNNAFRICAKTDSENGADCSSDTNRILKNAANGSSSTNHAMNGNANAVIIAGTRGWLIPAEESEEADVKIYRRELIRLELSLNEAQKLRKDGDTLIVMFHYPPFDADFSDTEMTALLEKYQADYALYGHLHGKNIRVVQGLNKNGITYFITSCDLTDNKLLEICKI